MVLSPLYGSMLQMAPTAHLHRKDVSQLSLKLFDRRRTVRTGFMDTTLGKVEARPQMREKRLTDVTLFCGPWSVYPIRAFTGSLRVLCVHCVGQTVLANAGRNSPIVWLRAFIGRRQDLPNSLVRGHAHSDPSSAIGG